MAKKNGKSSGLLYLAYGSNLNHKDMQRRCPGAVPVGTRLLDNARLVFRGVADLALEPGCLTPAGLWRITKADEEALDRYEGVGSGLYSKYMVPIGGDDKALIYLMNDNGIYPPARFYVETIRQGYRDFKLDQSFLNEAIRHCFTNKIETEQTRSRRERQRKTRHLYELCEIPEDVAIERLDRQRRRIDEISQPDVQPDGFDTKLLSRFD